MEGVSNLYHEPGQAPLGSPHSVDSLSVYLNVFPGEFWHQYPSYKRTDALNLGVFGQLTREKTTNSGSCILRSHRRTD